MKAVSIITGSGVPLKRSDVDTEAKVKMDNKEEERETNR